MSESENASTLRAMIHQLAELAHGCKHDPGERSARRVCEGTREVSNTVEGMQYKNATIEPDLLSNALEVITESIRVVSAMKLPVETSLEDKEHIRKMIQAMADRRDDLFALQKEGKMAFLQRR